jgi:hypothetical protein
LLEPIELYRTISIIMASGLTLMSDIKVPSERNDWHSLLCEICAGGGAAEAFECVEESSICWASSMGYWTLIVAFGSVLLAGSLGWQGWEAFCRIIYDDGSGGGDGCIGPIWR